MFYHCIFAVFACGAFFGYALGRLSNDWDQQAHDKWLKSIKREKSS